MGNLLRFLGLPTPLLVLLSSTPSPALTQTLEWPYSLPAHVKYYPEHEALIKRGNDIQQKLDSQPVMAVRKMSDDAGEKFFLEYWSFGQKDYTQDSERWSNQSFFSPLDNALRVHIEEEQPSSNRLPRGLRFAAKSIFGKRDFQCPSGSSPCTSIDRPNSCCASGTTCQLIQDTGLGDVGCCPSGETCAGSLSTCEPGYTSCPNNPGGGCCLPGYACFDVGCVLTSTATVVIATTPPSTPSTTTATSTTTITPSTSASSSSLVSKSTLPIIHPTTTTTHLPTTTSSILTCRSGYKSCAASLGGGCCPTDRACGSADCPATKTSGSVIPPVRPTTRVTTTSHSQVTSSSSRPSICPTGFYACSAYYEGGCCQIGRDCGKTSCPTSASTTLIDSNGITLVAPTGSGITAPGTVLTGTCAHGWQSCAQTDGGGCCPTNFSCGASCVATASGPAGPVGTEIGKVAPNNMASLNPSAAGATALFVYITTFGITLMFSF